MKNKFTTESSMRIFLMALVLIGVGFFFVGCGSQTEENSTLPWSQPSGWENNKMPAMMPNYGDRNY